MDYGVKAKCVLCPQEFYMYTQTYPVRVKNDKTMIGGICPRCSAQVTAFITDDNKVEYDMGDSYHE